MHLRREEMSLKQTAIWFLQFGHVPDLEEFGVQRRVPSPAHAGPSVVAAVAVGGVLAGMSLTAIVICGLVAGGGVALFCAVAGCSSTAFGPQPALHSRVSVERWEAVCPTSRRGSVVGSSAGARGGGAS
jgi:hypothetical protein